MIFNKKRTLKRLTAFILILVTFALLKIYVNKFQEVKYYLASAPVKNVVEGTEKLDSVSPPFIYLTQTEQCLPSKLVQNLQLNVSSECQCEVIVLSYETESQEESPPHFTYLFDNTTTWGSGRNKLFFHAVERRLDYIYYIFLDDDIALKFNGVATSAMKRLSPIRVFQDWLLDYEPAVGVVDYKLKREAKTVLHRRRTLCNRYRLVNDKSLANPTIYFDPLLNAFHAKAVSHIFPLDTRHEKVNWWLTDKYVTSVVELKFRGQALLFFPVTVENLLHRPYPRSFY
ncbi:hypothetical protein OS493_025538 [Desmophyllum pertusum]|uniref:Uncharacterized protein n=1 Tax=Desmophyllum pertusum TaxID=174260 RepID=A0A9W9Y9X4_9CNID|nr:hypothetical protein OS493_025538 [Desmophyllum pertusum]